MMQNRDPNTTDRFNVPVNDGLRVQVSDTFGYAPDLETVTLSAIFFRYIVKL